MGAWLRSPIVYLCAAAFLSDMALYLVMTGVPYKAIALGAGPLALGLLPAARGLPYALTSFWASGLSESKGRLRWARWTLALAVPAALATAFAPSVPWIYVLLAIVGVAFAFFWPAVQASLADLALRRGMAGNLGWFNVAWSSGKATGFIAGGLVLAGFGFVALFAMAGTAIGAVIFLLTRPAVATLRTREAGLLPHESSKDPRLESLSRWRLAAWIGNGVAFGMGAVLNIQYPQRLEELKLGEALFGAYLGLIFFAQTATFVLMAKFPGWRFRRGPMLVSQFPLVVVMALLPWLRTPAAILATALPVGVGLGGVYAASLYYSVAGSHRRGQNAGVHEGLLGLGSLFIPLLAGLAATATGALSASFLLSAGMGLLSMAIQATLLIPEGRKTRGEA